MKSRRDFLKAASAGLGGILVSCSTPDSSLNLDNSPPTAQLPNGYSFQAIKNTGDMLPTGKRIEEIRYDNNLDANDEVFYSAIDETGRLGLYAAQLDVSGENVKVVSERTILVEGDRVETGTIRNYVGFDINEAGDVVVTLKVDSDRRVALDTIRQHVQQAYGTASGPELERPSMQAQGDSSSVAMSGSGSMVWLAACST